MPVFAGGSNLVVTTTGDCLVINDGLATLLPSTSMMSTSTGTIASTHLTSTSVAPYFTHGTGTWYTVTTSTSLAPNTQVFLQAADGTWRQLSETDMRAQFAQVKPLVRPKPTNVKRPRNAIKRALKLMFDLGFEEEARVFIKGQTIEVAHPDSLFKFVIERYKQSLIGLTERPGYSTPYHLSLYTKDNLHVADLCVYMKNTPVLDQVLGLAMFIKSGDEELILKQANWRSLSTDMEMREILALEYPYLIEKLKLDSVRIHHQHESISYV